MSKAIRYFITILFVFTSIEGLAQGMRSDFNNYKKGMDGLLNLGYIEKHEYYGSLYKKLRNIKSFPGKSDLLSRYKELINGGSSTTLQQSSHAENTSTDANAPVISLDQSDFPSVIDLQEVQLNLFNLGKCLDGPKGQIAKCISDYYRIDNNDRQKSMAWFIEAKKYNSELNKTSLINWFAERGGFSNLYHYLRDLNREYQHLESMHPYYTKSYEKFWNWLSENNNDINELKVNYVNQIATKIKNNWRYRGAKDGWGCDVHILQDRNGNVKGHNLKSCYIDDNSKVGSFKNSIKRAVFKASPLPIAPNSSEFDEQIVFRFNVDDSNRKLAQGDIPNELKVNIDYDYLKTKVIDSGTCGIYKNIPSRVTSCIANHYLVAKGDYKNALLWYLESRNTNKYNLYKQKIDKIKTKLGRVKFEEIKYQYNSGSIKLKDVRLWAYPNSLNTNAVKTFSRNKASSDSFSDLWGQYGGSILDSKSNYTKQQSNFTSTSTADTKAPVISLDQNNFTTVESSNINLSGSIKDDSDVAEVNINGGLIAVDDSGNFDRTMYLSLGKNKFTIEALDIFGNKSSKTISVIRNMIIVENKDKELTPPTVQLASNPDSVALIIGLDDYKTMPNAPWAESDASTFYDYAHNVLGIPTERIRLITGQESDGIGIWKSLEQWLPSQVDKNKSNIYVYFAGHGLASEDGKEAYLMPYDGDTSMLSRTAISRKDVITGLDSLKARSVTLFMDTCYSGSAKGGKQTLVASRGLRIVKKDTLSDLPSNFTLFSAAANDETAISHPTQKNGLFSYWMMRGLGGEADSNNDNKLTNGELHAFISDKVQKTAISKGHKQNPQLVGDKDKVIASW
jgi:hypothetical protein